MVERNERSALISTKRAAPTCRARPRHYSKSQISACSLSSNGRQLTASVGDRRQIFAQPVNRSARLFHEIGGAREYPHLKILDSFAECTDRDIEQQDDFCKRMFRNIVAESPISLHGIRGFRKQMKRTNDAFFAGFGRAMR